MQLATILKTGCYGDRPCFFIAMAGITPVLWPANERNVRLLVLDEVANVKKGSESVGVSRQWYGARDKFIKLMQVIIRMKTATMENSLTYSILPPA